MTINSDDFNKWIGKTETTADDVTLAPLNAMAATLDKKFQRFQVGDQIPALWHWAYFLHPAPQKKLAKDGHPERGDFLPPIPLPRRMWAGSRLHFISPIHAGDHLSRKSTIKNITIKEGKSGLLAFVNVLHEISTPSGTLLSEEHDIVYREKPSSDNSTSPRNTVAAPISSDFSARINPDPVFLFRYSALTFNGHRIHYDREYARLEEGYPGLIVHGPLLATLLIGTFAEHNPSAEIKKFEFRATNPVFDTNSFEVCGMNPNSDGEASVWIKNHNGNLCMQAQISV
ncbi:MaoC family dehydratase N-terminal domain-containing protein [Gammaproteobacteria bacterium]|nr:MaoC family dehydratase N-terminal domain-containing protein [Gammaproteobacteria bacterium]